MLGNNCYFLEFLLAIMALEVEMGKGKIAAQVGHASVQAFLNAGASYPSEVEAWLASGQKKICLKVPEADDFTSLRREAQRRGIPFHLVQDAGHTQIPKGSSTVLAIGPFDEDVLDELTGHLKLL